VIHRLTTLGAAAATLPLLVNAAESLSPAATVSRYLEAAGRNQVSEMEVLRDFDRQALRELSEAAGTKPSQAALSKRSSELRSRFLSSRTGLPLFRPTKCERPTVSAPDRAKVEVSVVCTTAMGDGMAEQRVIRVLVESTSLGWRIVSDGADN
jgi:hypothetical protein